MNFWLILALAAALPWGFVAQDGASPQQQLPNAPSAAKYPAPPPDPPPQPSNPSSTPTARPSDDIGTPLESLPANPAPASAATQSGTPTPKAAAQQNNTPSSTASSSTPAKNDAKSNPASAEDIGKSSDTDDQITVIRKRVDEVNVVFTVTDKRDHFVKDLTQKDFRVMDDNKPALSIQSFSRQTNLPLRVGLLIDASNSVRDRFKFEQEAAIEFLNQIIRPRFDKAFVIGFDTTPEVTQDFTDSAEQLSRGVRMLRPGGGTALYDAIYFAARDKLMQDKSEIATRRAIILLSDGEDNQSRVSREEAVEMAQRAEVIIYTISTNTSGTVTRGDKVLKHFAEETGGKAFYPFKIEDVANAFTEISDELRSQYAIAYKPADFLANGKYRSIEILADNKKYHVRARKGYYAPTQ